jgi:hypothetical protein
MDTDDMPDETMNSQIEKINRAIREIPDVMMPFLKRAMSEFGGKFLRVFTRERLKGGGVRMRSGSLARSFNYNVLDQAGKLTLVVWSTSKYARLQEFGTKGLPGGVLRPKNARALAIPVGPALTPSGVSKFTSPRQVAGLQVFKPRFKLPFLGMVGRGKKAMRVTPWFLLRKSVKIEGNMKLFITWKEQAPGVIPMMAKAADDSFSKSYKRI